MEECEYNITIKVRHTSTVALTTTCTSTLLMHSDGYERAGLVCPVDPLCSFDKRAKRINWANKSSPFISVAVHQQGGGAGGCQGRIKLNI
jgi:hypothetical protein